MTNKRKPPKGRPSQFDEARPIILRALRQGAPIRTACYVAGISKSAYYEWRRLGSENRRSEYYAFVLETGKAISEAELSLISVIRRAATKGDWRAALAILERRWPEEYARRVVQVNENRVPDNPPPPVITVRPDNYVPGQQPS